MQVKNSVVKMKKNILTFLLGAKSRFVGVY